MQAHYAPDRVWRNAERAQLKRSPHTVTIDTTKCAPERNCSICGCSGFLALFVTCALGLTGPENWGWSHVRQISTHEQFRSTKSCTLCCGAPRDKQFQSALAWRRRRPSGVTQSGRDFLVGIDSLADALSQLSAGCDRQYRRCFGPAAGSNPKCLADAK